MQIRSKFLLPIVSLVIITFFFIIANIIINAEEAKTIDLNAQKVNKQEIFKKEKIAIKETNAMEELNAEDTNEQEEIDIKKTLTQDGKIDLSPKVEPREPEFTDIELLRLDDKLLEKKLNYYSQSLIDVVQFKIEKNNNRITQIQEGVKSNIEKLDNQHKKIKNVLLQMEGENTFFRDHLLITKRIIIAILIIGLSVTILTFYIWRSIVNVNKNEVEVVNIAENMKFRITELQNEIDMLKKKME